MGWGLERVVRWMGGDDGAKGAVVDGGGGRRRRRIEHCVCGFLLNGTEQMDRQPLSKMARELSVFCVTKKEDYMSTGKML